MRRGRNMTISDELYLAVSNILNYRVTPDSLRAKMDAISGTGGVTSKVKTDIIQELLIAFAKLETKIDDK